MSAAEENVLRMQAALDGELDAQGMLEFERACAGDPQLAADFARLRAIDAALRAAAPVEAAPAALRARMAALSAPDRKARPATHWRAPAMAASLLLGAAIGYGGASLRPDAPSADRALVSAFMRSQIGGRGVDIETSDRHVVKPWLASRAPLAVAALDLSSAGFPLEGGRVEAIDGKIVPTLVYRRREHRIEVTELALDRGDAALQLSNRDGYHLANWSDSDRAYVAVTDLPEAELKNFVDLFRTEAKREREGPRPR